MLPIYSHFIYLYAALNVVLLQIDLDTYFLLIPYF